MASLDDNPHYWLAAYGIQAHYFKWAVATGALDDIDPPAGKDASWVQPSLLPGIRAQKAVKRPRRLYRSPPPHRADALTETGEDWRIIRALPSRPVLRGGLRLNG